MNNSVLVIGGGIAGMQASIDLGDMGFQVYLVERSPSIGGRMAQLDKTFPTNDCAMCILAPKMMDCYRHENVKVLTYSEVVGINGELGNFQVRVLKKPRYIDETKCTGCGDCAEVCPVEVKNEFDIGMGTRKAVYKLFAQAVPNLYTVDKRGISPCSHGCPAGTRVQGYVALISQGKFAEALDVVRDTLPFPATCGRVCHHPCEDQCHRKDIDESISTRLLHKFIADWARENGEESPEAIEPTREEKVAIIGAGPSGLTCALRLLKKGYPVTIFEASDKAGGMITGCVPDYRNPREIADYEINRILAHGMELRTNVKVGRDITLEELRKEYKAVYIAIGAQEPERLPMEGAEAKGILYGLPFLREVKSGRKVSLGNRVAVIGGGNTAVDTARVARRLGAQEVTIVYRRSRAEMPAAAGEVDDAEREGIRLHILATPVRVLSQDGRLTSIECTRMELGEADASGRRRPIPVVGSEFTIDVDSVIIAVGQTPDLTGFEDIEQTPRQTIKTDEITLETSIPGVFSGGDIVRGPASVIEAVAHGNEAAESIDRFLNGVDLKQGRAKEVQVAPLRETEVEKKERVKVPKRGPRKRVKDFDEIELGFTEQAAVEEANRCLNCAVCSDCRQCEVACQAKALLHDMEEEYLNLNVGAIIVSTGLDFYDISGLVEYGYGKIKDVITSMEYERLTSASGPTAGELKRPSDGKIPSTIAFIQCVGCRDFKNLPYCSSVCCMHSAKEAIMAYEHYPGTKSYVLYMDTRAVSKQFQEYVTRAKEEYNVTYIRSRPGKIEVNLQTQNPVIWYEDTTSGETKSLETELVVLAQAMTASHSIRDLATILEIDLNEHGFVEIPYKLLHPLDSNRPGIFACGYAHSPRDIPDSVIQGSGAAGRAAEILAEGG